jgi:hypothetical protein
MSRVQVREIDVVVIGLGLGGLYAARYFANQGYSVVGFDNRFEYIRPHRIALSPFTQAAIQAASPQRFQEASLFMSDGMSIAIKNLEKILAADSPDDEAAAECTTYYGDNFEVDWRNINNNEISFRNIHTDEIEYIYRYKHMVLLPGAHPVKLQQQLATAGISWEYRNLQSQVAHKDRTLLYFRFDLSSIPEIFHAETTANILSYLGNQAGLNLYRSPYWSRVHLPVVLVYPVSSKPGICKFSVLIDDFSLEQGGVNFIDLQRILAGDLAAHLAYRPSTNPKKEALRNISFPMDLEVTDAVVLGPNQNIFLAGDAAIQIDFLRGVGLENIIREMECLHLSGFSADIYRAYMGMFLQENELNQSQLMRSQRLLDWENSKQHVIELLRLSILQGQVSPYFQTCLLAMILLEQLPEAVYGLLIQEMARISSAWTVYDNLGMEMYNLIQQFYILLVQSQQPAQVVQPIADIMQAMASGSVEQLFVAPLFTAPTAELDNTEVPDLSVIRGI